MKVTLRKQECDGSYKFNSQIVYTKGMESIFGEDVFLLIYYAMNELQKLVKQNIADYFQVFEIEYNGRTIRVWCIDDIDHITFLLPQEW